MKRFTKAIASGVTAISLLASPAIVFADGTGQIGGGPAVYEAKNITTGGAYSDNTTVAACQEVQYSIQLHNSGFVAVNNINVKVTLPSAASTSNTSTVNITYTDGIVPSTSDTTVVNSATAQSLAYEPGTTILYNGSGTQVAVEPDTILTSGVNLGSLNGSTTEFLNFRAKTPCAPPVTPAESCDLLQVTKGDHKVTINTFNKTATDGAVYKNVNIAWGDNTSVVTVNPVGLSHTYSGNGPFTITATPSFTVNGQTVSKTGPLCVQQVSFTTAPKTPPKTPTPPSTLVNTGAGDTIGLFAAVTAIGAFAFHRIQRRRLAE